MLTAYSVISDAYNYFSNYSLFSDSNTSNTPLENEAQKVHFLLKNNDYHSIKGAFFSSDSLLICPIINHNKVLRNQIEVWKLTPEPEFLFRLGTQEQDHFMNPQSFNDLVFLPYRNSRIQVGSLKTGKLLTLDSHWKTVRFLSLSRDVILHVNKEDPGKIFVSSPLSLGSQGHIANSITHTLDMAYINNQIYHLGLTEDNVGKLIIYKQGEGIDEGQRIEKEFPNDTLYGDGNSIHSLDVIDSKVFNHSWRNKSTQIWDEKTGDVILEVARKESWVSYTEVSGNYAAITDGVNILEIYEQKKEHEKFLRAHTKSLFGEDNTLWTHKLIEFSNQVFVCAGFYDGRIILWDVKTGNQFCELLPLKGMLSVISLQKVNNNKLLAHYNKAGNDGTLAICWDLNTQKPCLEITRDGLANRDYDGRNDDVFFDPATSSIVVRSENEGFLYKNYFQCNTSKKCLSALKTLNRGKALIGQGPMMYWARGRDSASFTVSLAGSSLSSRG